MKLVIEGMSCGHCERAVADALAALPGVHGVVSADRESGEARLEGERDIAAAIRVVVAEGYEARSA